MVINRVTFFQKPVNPLQEAQSVNVAQNCKYTKDQGGFSGGIRAKGLQHALLQKMLPSPESYRVIKLSEVLESHEQTLPKNPVVDFFHKAESFLTTMLACKQIRGQY